MSRVPVRTTSLPLGAALEHVLAAQRRTRAVEREPGPVLALLARHEHDRRAVAENHPQPGESTPPQDLHTVPPGPSRSSPWLIEPSGSGATTGLRTRGFRTGRSGPATPV